MLAVDGVRFLLNKVREEVKDMKDLDLKDGLLKFVDGRRAYIKRRLQYFINMVLLPEVGFGKTKVNIVFDGWFLDPREFTVNVKPNEDRDWKKDPLHFLRSLQEVTECITNTLVEALDFTRAFKGLKV